MTDMTASSTRFDFSPVHAALQRWVDQEVLAGVSIAVLHGRELVDVHCAGWADREAKIPLRTDHLFPVNSNTKLVTSCAVLMLIEEGHFGLDDPIERFLPRYSEPRVLRRGAVDLADTEPATRPITVRHLLSHCSGLTYSLFDPGAIMSKAYVARGVLQPSKTLAESVDLLSELPLLFHPGTAWEYSVSTDVLGRLVEVVSGQPYEAFIRSRILEPLGMHDTGYLVAEAEQHRLAPLYAGADPSDPTKPGLTRMEAPYPGAYRREVALRGGGAGLVSSLGDMVALLRSLLPGGRTLLSSETIALLGKNQLPEGVWVSFPGKGEFRGNGFGLAGAVIVDPMPIQHSDSLGEIFWGGTGGTQWWISPRLGVAGAMMTHRMRSLSHPFAFEAKRLVYEAMNPRQ